MSKEKSEKEDLIATFLHRNFLTREFWKENPNEPAIKNSLFVSHLCRQERNFFCRKNSRKRRFKALISREQERWGRGEGKGRNKISKTSLISPLSRVEFRISTHPVGAPVKKNFAPCHVVLGKDI